VFRGRLVIPDGSSFFEIFLKSATAVSAKNLYAFGPFRLDPVQRLLFREGEVVSLTPKALDTLLALVENRGTLLAKDELLEMVWPGTFVEEGTLAKNVSTLRKALGEAPAGGEYIETHSKRGYRFVAQVREEVEQQLAAAGTPSNMATSVSAAPAVQRRWHVPAAALAVVLVVAAAGAGLWYRGRMAAAPASRKIMLAVLPFENLGGDPAEDYFSTGLTEEMITQLGGLEPEKLGVIARTSAMQYKGSHKDVRQIAAELGVDYVLEGSVRREGGRVRIAAQLIQVRDQSHKWAEDYDRDLRDILALQSDVAGAIAEQIRLKLTPEGHARLRNTRTVNPEAYENYLRGRFFWNKRTAEGHEKAIEYFQKAVVLDPVYAQAYAGLADAYALLGSAANQVLPRREAMDHARAAADKALQLDDSRADAHASLGFVKMHYDWDFAGAEKEFQRAIVLNPGYATAHHWYAYDLVALARLDDALAEIRLAQQDDPLSVIISRDVGEILLFVGRDQEAIAQCQKTLELDPSFSLAHWVLAWAYRRQGHEKQFLAELAKSLANPGVAEGIIYAVQGKRPEALRVVSRLEKVYGTSTGIATVYWFLGDKGRAFAFFEKAFEEREGSLIVMRFIPEWEPIRFEPRFIQLERRVGVLR
jgi:TolB-like protein/DNA-binding winged helix-turn-helix (wHTH) protein